MKVFTFILTLMALIPYTSLAQEDPISAFQLKWENSKKYLMEIAELMPEGKYDYQPSERQMSFQEQLLHIRRNMLWLSHDYIAEKKLEKTDHAALSKEKTMRLLTSAFDQVSEIVSQMDPNDLAEKVAFKKGINTKLQILNLIQDHVTHHRGQLIIYLNLQGIEPPDYVGW